MRLIREIGDWRLIGSVEQGSGSGGGHRLLPVSIIARLGVEDERCADSAGEGWRRLGGEEDYLRFALLGVLSLNTKASLSYEKVEVASVCKTLPSFLVKALAFLSTSSHPTLTTIPTVSDNIRSDFPTHLAHIAWLALSRQTCYGDYTHREACHTFDRDGGAKVRPFHSKEWS